MEKGELAAFEFERNTFGELAMTPESKQLLNLFNAQTECKKNPFKVPEQPIKYAFASIVSCYLISHIFCCNVTIFIGL